MKHYTAEAITAALKEACFSKVKIDHHRNKLWLTVLAVKWLPNVNHRLAAVK